MFDQSVIDEVTQVANSNQIEPAAMLAVAEVESGGKAFAEVNGQKVPLIRWEGHYFHQRLAGEALKRAVKEGLAAPKAGAIPNPNGQAARYALLAQARAIDADAANQSVSWGVGQVMGANWESLGYASTQALVDEAMAGVAGQVRLMIAFIRQNNIADELRDHDWAGFARVYNGKNFKKYKYDDLMAAAYRRHSKGASGGTQPAQPAGTLKVGSKGPAVKQLQIKLRRLGYHLLDDGDFGTATRTQLTRFQSDNGLKADGIAGPMTLAKIDLLLGVNPKDKKTLFS